jgi:predicted 3-demethylubiquinone-9 3-methyltransferase (glyoxalase superfamily)
MPETVPCMWFDGRAEQAAEFYCSVFPRSKVTHVQRYPEGNPFPAPFAAGTAMAVEFELDGRPYTAINGGPELHFNEATSVQILCDDQDEIDHYWDALTADGGEESVCGWLKDRYGFSWQVIPCMLRELAPGRPAQARAVAEAVFAMGKLDIAALQRVYDQA